MPQSTTIDETRPFRVRWTRADCTRFERDGLLAPGEYELIEGDILRKMGQKRPHALALTLSAIALRGVFGDLFVQGPATIDVSPEDEPTSEPEPDLIVLTRPCTEIVNRNPRPGELSLVMEISDATRYFDRGTKADLYARAGIVEYWSLDLVARALRVHRQPASGKYQSVVVLSPDDSVAPLAASQIVISVRALLPPEETP